MRRCLVVFFVATILSVGFARAEGAYAGASVGRTSLKETNGLFSFSGTDTGMKVFAGYRIQDFIGVEGSYLDLGAPVDTNSGFRRKTSVSGLDFFGVGVLPFPRVELFAKVGFMAWTKESTTSGAVPTSTAEDSGAGVAFGAGATVNWGRHLRLRAEWEVFDVRGTNRVDFQSLGVDWRF